MKADILFVFACYFCISLTIAYILASDGEPNAFFTENAGLCYPEETGITSVSAQEYNQTATF